MAARAAAQRCNSQYELCYRSVPLFLVSLHWIYRALSFVHGILLVFCRNERYLPASCFSQEFCDCKVIFPLKNFDVFLSCRRWLYFGLYCIGKYYSKFGFRIDGSFILFRVTDCAFFQVLVIKPFIHLFCCEGLEVIYRGLCCCNDKMDGFHEL